MDSGELSDSSPSIKKNAPIKFGVCCMEGKLKGKPMVTILSYLEETGEYEVTKWNNDILFNSPIENWPKCDVLLGFYSTGYPIDKVIEYVKVYKPFCINDLESQKILWERSEITRMLFEAGVPTARSFTVIRNKEKMSQQEIED